MRTLLGIATASLIWGAVAPAFADGFHLTRGFVDPEFGAAAHVILRPIPGIDDTREFELPRAGLSIVGAPVGWLVLEGIWTGIFEVQPRSLTGLMRLRLVRQEHVALSFGAGAQWVKEMKWEYPRFGSARDVIRIPIEAMLEFRPGRGLSFRPYLGVSIPTTTSGCELEEERADPDAGDSESRRRPGKCRIPASLYLGLSALISFGL